jgi:hypothetical protein
VAGAYPLNDASRHPATRVPVKREQRVPAIEFVAAGIDRGTAGYLFFFR